MGNQRFYLKSHAKLIVYGQSHLPWEKGKSLDPIPLRLAKNLNPGAVAREIILRKLSDKDTRELLKPRTEAIDKARIETAQAAIGVATPIGLKLETPEDMERAAEALRREAKRQREEAMSPEQIAAMVLKSAQTIGSYHPTSQRHRLAHPGAFLSKNCIIF